MIVYMRDIALVKKMIRNKEFDNAEKCIEKILKSTKSAKIQGACYFYLGEIYKSHYDSEACQRQARDYYHKALQRDVNVPQAYTRFAFCEKDPHVRLNYLRIGHKRFPQDSSIFTNLFNHVDEDEKNLLLASCLEDQKISSYDYLHAVVEYLWIKNRWNDLDRLLSRILTREEDEKIKIHTELLLGCVCLFKRTNYRRAVKLLKDAIERDVDNELQNSHYLILACAYIQSGNLESAKKTFDKITFNNVFSENFVFWNAKYNISAYRIYTPAYNLLEDFFAEDSYRLAKSKCLAACSMIDDFDENNDDNLENEILALKNFLELAEYSFSLDILKYLVRAHVLTNNYWNAWLVLSDSRLKYSDKEFVNDNINDVINNFSEKELELAVENILKEKNINTIELKNIIDPVIRKLWDNKKHEAIKNIAKHIDVPRVFESKFLFQIAYSLCQFNDELGKLVYLHLLSKEPKNSSVLNNLGVIANNEGDYDKAYEYYNTAYQIDSNDDLIHSNMLHALAKKKEAATKLELFKTSLPEFKRKFLEFSECSDLEHNLSKDIISHRTGLPVKEVSQIWQKALQSGFLEKIQQNGIEKFRINYKILDYLQENKDFLRSNIKYEAISEKLNIDSLQNIGYTKELKSRLCNISPQNIREMLIRDIHECAISLIVGSFKSAILVAGGVIEHILLYVLTSNNIQSYDVGAIINKKSNIKKVVDMNLGELLEVAQEKNLIRKENYHLSQFARSYRNAIHPGKEIKIASEINKETAIMLWKILLNLVDNCFHDR